MKKDPVLDALQKASKGLRYTSETDAPLQSFVWEGGSELTPEQLRKHAGIAPDVPIEETTLDGFFHAVPSEDRAKFQKLAQVWCSPLTRRTARFTIFARSTERALHARGSHRHVAF